MRPWSWPTEDLEPEAMGFVRDLGMPRAVARTLVRRGFHHDEDLARYLHPKLGRLGDPATLDDMDRAVERVWRAVDASETIFVHGDYDVDGITGTAFLARTMKAMGAQVIPYVPDRSDGYGLSDHGVDVARDAGARVLITVDNGTRAFAEIERARDAGLDVVVLDHHELAESLPAAYALVNPQRNRDAHGFEHLSGVGVAAKFVHAMAAARPGPVASRHLQGSVAAGGAGHDRRLDAPGGGEPHPRSSRPRPAFRLAVGRDEGAEGAGPARPRRAHLFRRGVLSRSADQRGRPHGGGA